MGYRIRLENKVSSETRWVGCGQPTWRQTMPTVPPRLCFVTTGILLRMLSSNTQLLGVSHVVVDEAGGAMPRCAD